MYNWAVEKWLPDVHALKSDGEALSMYFVMLSELSETLPAPAPALAPEYSTGLLSPSANELTGIAVALGNAAETVGSGWASSAIGGFAGSWGITRKISIAIEFPLFRCGTFGVSFDS